MAMTSDLRYDFWDILKAPRIALSGKGLLAQARSLLYGYAAYFSCSYLALLLNGQPFAYSWEAFGLFPLCNLGLSQWYSWTVWILGIIVAVGFYDYGNLTVAKLGYEELRGNYFFSARDAARDARANLLPLWVSGGLVAFLIAVLAAIQGLVSLVALIPGIGGLLYAILYVVPFFLWSLFLVFLTFGLTTSVLTLPAIIVAREKDTFGATFYIYNIIWTQPLRWLGMTAFGLVLAKIGMFVIGYFFMRALQLTNFLAGWFGGDKTESILIAAYTVLEPLRGVVRFFTTLYPGSSIGYDPEMAIRYTMTNHNWILDSSQSIVSGADQAAAVIIALGLLGILILIISYGINIITNSQLLAFLLIAYKEDKVKLTEDVANRIPEPNEILPEKPQSDSTTA